MDGRIDTQTDRQTDENHTLICSADDVLYIAQPVNAGR